MLFRKKESSPPEGMVFLTTAGDIIEAEVIESRLKASGIPILRKHRGPGGYMAVLLGFSTYGIDLFVPEDRADVAKSILESADGISDEDILSDPSFNDESVRAANEEYLKKLDRRNIWMAVFFIAAIPVLIYFISVNM